MGCFSSGRRAWDAREILGAELGLGPVPPAQKDSNCPILCSPLLALTRLPESTQNQNVANHLFFIWFSFFFLLKAVYLQVICNWNVTFGKLWSHLVVVQGGQEVGLGWWGHAAQRAALPLNPSQDVCRISWRRGGACLRRFPKSLCFFWAESLWFWVADFLLCSRKMCLLVSFFFFFSSSFSFFYSWWLMPLAFHNPFAMNFRKRNSAGPVYELNFILKDYLKDHRLRTEHRT